FLHCYVHLSRLHSFPTRRSSDLLTEDSLSPHHVPSGTSEDARDHLEGLNSTAVSRALCSENGWSGKEMILTLRDAIESLAKQMRSEEHTSELQSRFDLVCRLLLE